jgi:hypothetical protein
MNMPADLRKWIVAIALSLVLAGAAVESKAATNTNRLRVIVASDFPPFPVTNSDPDDVQSMVRFLLLRQ